MKRNLYVMIPTRDRTLLTTHTICSILDNSTKFDNIYIYVFDNLSELNKSRLDLFYKLLRDKKIHYYSYDTNESLHNCFGKSIVFYRWLIMMNQMNDLNKKMIKPVGVSNYYLLIDNDMLVGEDWDSQFVEAVDNLNTFNPKNTIHFCIKYPGGIPFRLRSATHIKKSGSIDVIYADGGGGSGFWFMGQHQMENIYKVWTINKDIIYNAYNVRKRHDTSTWSFIRKTIGPNNYMMAVLPKNKEDNPLVMHLGGLKGIGSICNTLMNPKFGENYYESNRDSLYTYEKELKDMNHKEIFNRFKNSKAVTEW